MAASATAVQPDATPVGAVDAFIARFNALEVAQRLFDVRLDDGFPFWDAVRYQLQFALCAERGIHAHQRREKLSRWQSARSGARQAFHLLRDLLTVARVGGRGLTRLYVHARRWEHVLADIAESGAPSLIVGPAEPSDRRNIFVRKASVTFFVRMASRFVRVPASVADVAARWDDLLKREFDSHVDVRAIVLKRYRDHRVAGRLWRFVLARLPALERVSFINDDTLRPLVYQANVRGIATREFQHSYMGRSNVLYDYPPLEQPVLSLPAEVVVHLDTGDIVYPVAPVRPAVASDAVAPADRDIDVLVGGSSTRNAEGAAIVAALGGRGLALAAKLHPNQDETAFGAKDRLAADRVQFFDKRTAFVDLVRRAKIYVPTSPTSTTIFEAVENGARLVMVNHGGIKVAGIIDRIASAQVDTVDDLYATVTGQLRELQAA